MMPNGDEIQRYLSASWRLMMGKPDAIRDFDVSADGFWNSFFAIVFAFPALCVGWTSLAIELAELGVGGRFSIFFRLAVTDITSWILPLLVLGLLARTVGIADRYPHFVVASNWGSALLAWLMLPASILGLFYSGPSDVADSVSLVIFLAAMVLTWRLTNASLAKGAAVASAVFFGVVVAGIVLIFFLQGLFGLQSPQLPGG